VKTASEMTFTVSGGALNSTQSNPGSFIDKVTIFHIYTFISVCVYIQGPDSQTIIMLLFIAPRR